VNWPEHEEFGCLHAHLCLAEMPNEAGDAADDGMMVEAMQCSLQDRLEVHISKIQIFYNAAISAQYVVQCPDSGLRQHSLISGSEL
jgi:hypothetical protein